MVATPAMAWLGLGPLRPAAAKHSGTTTAMPSPIRAKPAIADGRVRARGRPAARRPSASTPPARTVRTAPKRSYHAVADEPGDRHGAGEGGGAGGGEAGRGVAAGRAGRPRTSPGSPPSANTAQKPIAPITSAERGGSAKRGGGFLVRGGPQVEHPAAGRQAEHGEHAGRQRRGARARPSPACAASVPPAEPTRAPALHMPCSPDMIDLPRRSSTSTPSAFIDHVGHARRGAVDEQRQAQPVQAGREGGQRRGTAHHSASRPRSAARGAEAVADPAGQRHRARTRRAPGRPARSRAVPR